MLFLASTEKKKKTSTHKGISLERFVQNMKCALGGPLPTFSCTASLTCMTADDVFFFQGRKIPRCSLISALPPFPPVHSRLPLPVASSSQPPGSRRLWRVVFVESLLVCTDQILGQRRRLLRPLPQSLPAMEIPKRERGNLPYPPHVPHPCFARSRRVGNTPPLEMYHLKAACVWCVRVCACVCFAF